MAIDWQNSTLLSLPKTAREVSEKTGDAPPHSSVVYRWCRQGIGGVRLEYIKIGRKMYTSYDALNRFFQRLAEADQESDGWPAPQANSRTAAHRRADFDRAERELEAGGVR